MRIVSLCPSLTELVFDLGRGADLVGITDWCVHPADRVGGLEKVGGTKNPRIARVRELAPDLVLMNEEENRAEDARALRQAGLACHVSFPRDIPGTAAMVRSIAAALERPREGESIAREIESRAARVRAAAEGLPRLPFAYVIWRRPWMTCSADTFASKLLENAGGRNVFAELAPRYPAFEPAELGRRAPELVLLCTEPYPFELEHARELAAASGLAPERFTVADGEYLSWHGSRTPAGIDYAARLVSAGREGAGGLARARSSG
jgi:ABC-type Fe3+-hydroxamate transport system substrate-binding protein